MLDLLVDLDRFILRCQLSGRFVTDVWVQFAVSTTVVAFLDSQSDSHFEILHCHLRGSL